MKSIVSVIITDTSIFQNVSKLILQVSEDEYLPLQVEPENSSSINPATTKIIVFVFEQWNEISAQLLFKYKSLFPTIKSICIFEKSASNFPEFGNKLKSSNPIYLDQVNFNYQFMNAILNLIELTETEEKTIEIATELEATRTKMKYYALTTLTILVIILILNIFIH